MPTILCFGDSNTHGYDPVTQQRLSRDERWPGVMRNQLGADYWVIEEGLGGRTTVFDDPLEPGRRGIDYLAPCLRSHQPLDLLILMLGTNDCKARFGVPASDIALGIERLIVEARGTDSGIDDAPPRILIVAPPPFAPLEPTRFTEMFNGGETKAAQFGKLYAEIATLHGCDFLDAGKVIVSSPLDAIHYDAAEHRKLGEAMAAKVRELFG
jgi:lysophospholipase L1-like esterase